MLKNNLQNNYKKKNQENFSMQLQADEWISSQQDQKLLKDKSYKEWIEVALFKMKAQDYIINFIQFNIIIKEKVQTEQYFLSIQSDFKHDLEDLKEKDFVRYEKTDLQQRIDFLSILCQNFRRSHLSYLNVESFVNLIDLDYIKLMMKQQFIQTQENYIQIITLQDKVIDFFLKYHVYSDFQYLRRINARELKLTNPLLRQTIRKINLSNSVIDNKYFSSENDSIIYYVKKALENYIPTNRFYLNITSEGHITVLELLLTLFEYGIVKNSEVDDIVQIINRKVQILKGFEAKLKEVAVVTELQIQQILKIKSLMSQILLQILFLRYDEKVYDVINPDTETNQLDLTISYKEEQTYKKIFYTIFSYMFSNTHIQNYNVLTVDCQEFTENILQILLDNHEQSEDDIYLRGLKLLENDLVQAYRYPDTNTKQLLQPYIDSLIKLQKEFTIGNYVTKEHNCLNEFIKIIEQIKVIGQYDNTTGFPLKIQRILADFNLVSITLQIMIGLHQFGDELFMQQYTEFLVSLCKSTYESQYELLAVNNFNIFKDFMHAYPGYMLITFYKIFSQSKFLLYQATSILQYFVQQFAEFNWKLQQNKSRLNIFCMHIILNIVYLFMADNTDSKASRFNTNELIVMKYFDDLSNVFKTKNKFFDFRDWISLSNLRQWTSNYQLEQNLDLTLNYDPIRFDVVDISQDEIFNGYCLQISISFFRVYNRCHEQRLSTRIYIQENDQFNEFVNFLHENCLNLISLKSTFMQYLYNQSIFWVYRYYEMSEDNSQMGNISSKLKDKKCLLTPVELQHFIKWIYQDLEIIPQIGDIVQQMNYTLTENDKAKDVIHKKYLNFLELAIIVPLLNFILNLLFESFSQKETLEMLERVQALNEKISQYKEQILSIIFLRNPGEYQKIPDSEFYSRFQVDSLSEESQKLTSIGKDMYQFVFKCLYQLNKKKADDYTFNMSQQILIQEQNYIYQDETDNQIPRKSIQNQNQVIKTKEPLFLNKKSKPSQILQRFMQTSNQKQQSFDSVKEIQNKPPKNKKLSRAQVGVESSQRLNQVDQYQQNRMSFDSDKSAQENEQQQFLNQRERMNQIKINRDNIDQVDFGNVGIPQISKESDKINDSIKVVLLRNQYQDSKNQIVEHLSMYLSSLKDDGESYYQNLIEFIIYQVSEMGGKVINFQRFMSLINVMTILFFNNTKTMQSEFVIVYKKLYDNKFETSNQQKQPFFKIVFEEMISALYMSLNAFPRGRMWLAHYLVVKFCLLFFKNCCEDNNQEIKSLIRQTMITPELSLVKGTLIILSKTIEASRILIASLSSFDTEQVSQQNIRKDQCELSIYCLDTLTEFLIGPTLQNQLEVYQDLHSEFMIILSIPAKTLNSFLFILKDKVLDYILAISDGCDPKIIETQSQNLDIIKLNNVMTTYFKILVKEKLMSDKVIGKSFHPKKGRQNPTDLLGEYIDVIFQQYKKNPEFNQHILIKVCFKIFLLLNTLSLKSSRVKQFLQIRDDLIDINKKKLSVQIDDSKQQNHIIEADLVVHLFFRLIWGKIEIIDQNGQIQKISYIRQPESYFLSSQTQIQFVNNANPQDAQDKLQEILERSEYFSFEMNYNMNDINQKNIFYTYLASGNVSLFEFLLFCQALIINIIALSVLKLPQDRDFKTEIDSPSIIVIGILIAIQSLIFSICWFYIRYPLIIRIKFKEYLFENPDMQVSYRDIFNIFIINSIFKNKEGIIFLYHFACSMLGLFLSNTFFTIELLSIMYFLHTMRYLVYTILKRWKLFFLAICLGIAFLFIFAQLIFFYNSDQFIDGPDVCYSLSDCFTYVIYYGVRKPGGIGDVIHKKFTGSEGFLGYYTLIMLFYLIINMIIFNIVFGIMIDAFVEIRQFIGHKENDLKNVCYICNMNRWDFQKNGVSFEKHIKNEHNLWQYVYFLSSLQSKNEKSLNGVELYILQKLRNRDTSWLPYKRSLQLESNDQVSQEEYSIEKFKTTLNEISDMLAEALKEE